MSYWKYPTVWKPTKCSLNAKPVAPNILCVLCIAKLQIANNIKQKQQQKNQLTINSFYTHILGVHAFGLNRQRGKQMYNNTTKKLQQQAAIKIDYLFTPNEYRELICTWANIYMYIQMYVCMHR